MALARVCDSCVRGRVRSRNEEAVMADPSSDRLPASSDGQFFLPGAESESQYAIFAGKAPNGNASTIFLTFPSQNTSRKVAPPCFV